MEKNYKENYQQDIKILKFKRFKKKRVLIGILTFHNQDKILWNLLF